MHKRALKEERQWRLSALGSPRNAAQPFKFGEGLGGMILLYLAIVAGVSLLFVLINHSASWLVPAALPSAFILGALLYYMLGLADRLWDWSVSRSGHLHAAFLLFFLFLPCFVVLFYLVLAYPLGLALSMYAPPGLADDYRRWILDVAAISALGAWGRFVFRKR
ncbi:MAG: hypothetical protein HGA96_11785 [Desulfobulbaceae bacterium]|nr:hypothetical protein [Desulfobulbaceae bacterium]